MEYTWFYMLNTNGGYFERYSTKKECFEEAVSNCLNYEKDMLEVDSKGEYIRVYIAEIEEYEEYIDARTIVEEKQQEIADRFDNVTHFDGVNIKWLEEELNKVWKRWKKREKINNCFYAVNHKPYKVYIEGSKIISYQLIK